MTLCHCAHLQIGDVIRMHHQEDTECGNCGALFGGPGRVEATIYAGHVLNPKFGLCDRFNLIQPKRCPVCGDLYTYTLLLCEDGLIRAWSDGAGLLSVAAAESSEVHHA